MVFTCIYFESVCRYLLLRVYVGIYCEGVLIHAFFSNSGAKRSFN